MFGHNWLFRFSVVFLFQKFPILFRLLSSTFNPSLFRFHRINKNNSKQTRGKWKSQRKREEQNYSMIQVESFTCCLSPSGYNQTKLFQFHKPGTQMNECVIMIMHLYSQFNNILSFHRGNESKVNNRCDQQFIRELYRIEVTMFLHWKYRSSVSYELSLF